MSRGLDTSILEQLDNFLDHCIVFDENMLTIYANNSACDFLGVSQRRVAQKLKVTDLVSFDPPLSELSDLRITSEVGAMREVIVTSLKAESQVKGQCRVFTWNREQGLYAIVIRDVDLEERLHTKYHGELEQKEELIEQLKEAQAHLEQKVLERTAEVRELSELQFAMLNSLSQGFLIFDSTGDFFPVYSSNIEGLFECEIKGKTIFDLLRVAKPETFQKWLDATFAELLPFEDMAPLAPQLLVLEGRKTLKLEYFPLRENTSLKGIVLVSTDISEQLKFERELDAERRNSERLVNLLKNKKQIQVFLSDLDKSFSILNAIDLNANKAELLRVLHTIKGGAAQFAIQKVVDLMHESEDQVVQDKWSNSLHMSMLKRLESEIVEFKEETKRLFGPHVATKERILELPYSDLATRLSQMNLPNHTEILKVLSLEPIERSLSPLELSLNQTLKALGKPTAQFVVEGGGILIDSELYAGFFQQLPHVMRNISDHGVEPIEERQKMGKPRHALVVVSCRVERERLIIKIRDDGRGIDVGRLRAKYPETLHERDLLQKIFDPQVSLAESVTEVSGRGVGLDAIKTSIQELGGTVSVDTCKGEWTEFTFELPYSTKEHLASIGQSAA